MIDRKIIQDLINSYNKEKITIGVLGGHSGLDVCRGAKKLGFKTLAVCQKNREKTYTKYYKTREDGRGCVDETFVLKKLQKAYGKWLNIPTDIMKIEELDTQKPERRDYGYSS